MQQDGTQDSQLSVLLSGQLQYGKGSYSYHLSNTSPETSVISINYLPGTTGFYILQDLLGKMHKKEQR